MANAFTNENAVNRWGKVKTRRYKAREITPVLVTPPGYLRVASLRQKNRPRYYVHRLVALAWVGGYVDGMHVNHINGIKTDNRACNLEWVSSADNIRHAWENGLCKAFGEYNGASKLTGEQVVAIRDAKTYNVPDAVIARMVGISASGVAKIVNNKTWVTHKTISDRT